MRFTLVAGSLLIVVLPLVFLALAYGYERWIVRRYETLLRAFQPLAVGESKSLAKAARAAGIEVVLLDRTATVEFDSFTGERAIAPSFVGGLAERALEAMTSQAQPEELAEVERSLEPFGARDQIRRALAGETVFAEQTSPSGQIVLFGLAVPRRGGGVAYLTKASRRGIRRLFYFRSDVYKLLAYQLPFALLFTLLFGYWLVRPIEQLARAALVYPRKPLAEQPLLRRNDEVGALARSLTALTKSLEERRRATVEIGADVAHELKNPLATIFASAEFIASMREVTPEKLRMASEHIMGAVERLKLSIDALQSLLRLEASIADELHVELDYAALVNEVLAEYRQDPRYSDYDLRAEIDPQLGRVALVAQRWKELLRNLIDNALVQPTNKRTIVVSARRTADSWFTAVTDFGPGISAGNRDKIFRRFFTQRPADAAPGTGLGLSIVEAVATAHSGTVEVESVVGEGATFRVTIPR